MTEKESPEIVSASSASLRLRRSPSSRVQRRIRVALIALGGAGIVILVALLLFHRSHLVSLGKDSRRAGERAAREAASLLDKRLDGLRIVDQIASELSGADSGVCEVAETLIGTLGDNPHVSSLLIAHKPDRPPDIRECRMNSISSQVSPTGASRYVGVARRRDGVTFQMRTYSEKEFQDRSVAEIDVWSVGPAETGQPGWSHEAHRSELAGEWFSGGYAVPFFRTDPKNPEPVLEGVVAAHLTADEFRREVFEAVHEHLGDFPIEASYAFVVSETGRILSHPNPSFIQGRSTLKSFSPRLETGQDILQLPSAGPNSQVRLLDDHFEEFSNQTSWVFFAPIREAGWWVAVVLDQVEVFRSEGKLDELKRGRISILLASLGVALALIGLVLRVERLEVRRLWAMSICFAVVCSIGIVSLWVLHVGEDPDSAGRKAHRIIQLVNSAIPSKVQLSYERRIGLPSRVIPTGIFVQSVEFTSANDVTVTGYIWQRYSSDLEDLIPEGDRPGFVFPESEQTETARAYRHETPGGSVIGWYFKAVLRQEFDYSHYPFDREEVWIRIWHSDLGEGILLAPDYAAYTSLDPDRKPGLELHDFVLEGWNVQRSFFSYRLNSYEADFGFDTFKGQREFPELYFDVGLSRDFLNPFVGYLIPLFGVSFLLFAILMTVRTHPAKAALLGFDTSTVLGFCAALFFVVILAHTSLRRTLAAQNIIYIEHFYFVVYVAILAVGVSALMIAAPARPAWVRYQDNLISRLLFWPFLQGTMLLITLLTFG